MKLIKNKVKVNVDVVKSPAQLGDEPANTGGRGCLEMGSWAGRDSGSVVSDTSRTERIDAVSLDLLYKSSSESSCGWKCALQIWAGRREAGAGWARWRC